MNLLKCLRALEWCGGVVRQVSDQEILDAKAQVGAGGMGCEPASAASVAGAKLLVAEGVIGPTSAWSASSPATSSRTPPPRSPIMRPTTEQFDKVLRSRGVDQAAFANRAVAVPNDLDEIIKAIQHAERRE